MTELRSMIRTTGWVGVAAIGLLLAGCGNRDERFYDCPLGKINLDRITRITPLITVGLDEYPLQPDGIAEALGKLRAGEYAYFRVRAAIRFDEFEWTVYQSEPFDKDTNPHDASDIELIGKGLQGALRIYRGIR